MQKIIWILSFFLCQISFAQINNGSFETTITDENPFDSIVDERPINWSFYTSIGTEITSDAYSGNNAVKIWSWYFGQTTSELFYGENFPFFGDTLTSRPTKLKGFYKFTDVNEVNQVKDSAVVIILLTKFNFELNQRDTIAYTKKGLIEKSTYSSFEFPINYRNTNVPDSISISFRSSYFEFIGSVPDNSNFLYLDDIELEHQSLSFYEIENNQVFLCPNPVENNLFIYPKKEYESFCVYSVDNKLVKQGKVENFTIDFSDFSNGVYLVKLYNNQNFIFKKVIKI